MKPIAPRAARRRPSSRACWRARRSRRKPRRKPKRRVCLTTKKRFSRRWPNAASSRTSASSRSLPRPSTRRWRSSAGRGRMTSLCPSISTACDRPSTRASSSTCCRTTPRIRPTPPDQVHRGRPQGGQAQSGAGAGPVHESAPAQYRSEDRGHDRALSPFHAAQDRRQAKAMVVTSSRLHAVRYKQAFDKYITEKGYTGIKTLVAFSGTVIDPDAPDVEYTEAGMNIDAQGKHIGQKELPERFATEEYQTGFDQPLLHTMYVDKRLAGIQAVQTLSRLNRTHPGKEDTFVLDFVNEPDEILAAFQPYYEQTLIGEQADPKQLYELHAKLDAQQVYHKAEVEEFCKIFYKPKRNQTAADHARMNACIDPAVGRFNELEEEEREEFRKTLTAFRNLYSFLSQVIPFQDTDLEKLYSYIRFLLTKLPRADYGPVYHFSDDVSLKYYRLQKIGEGSIDLEPGKTEPVDGPTAVGTKAAHPDDIELSRLIDILNERFGTEFKPGDELFFESIREDAVADSNLRQAAMANTMENFGYVFHKALEGLFIDRMDQN